MFQEAIDNYKIDNNIEQLHITTALIDMDGVLYDSMPFHTIAWHHLATELGIEAVRDEFYLYEGMTGAATIRLLFKRAFNRDVTDEEAAELYAKKAQYFNEIATFCPITGAQRMTSILRESGIERVLVTGSGQASLLNKLNNDYPDIFDIDKRVTAHDVKHGKPNPEPYFKGMEKVNRKATQCMVIENAPLGVESGAKAGCFVVAITTGPIPVETMKKAGAHLVFSSMTEFADALPQLLNALKG